MHTIIKLALTVLLCAGQPPRITALPASSLPTNPFPTVGDIPTPTGFHRVAASPHDFTGFLRHLPLKKDRTVYLYNGQPKANQDAQFAVLDLPIGHEDLLQCADAVMCLRAEYLYADGNFEAIDFYTEQGVRLNFKAWAADHHGAGRASFDSYLRKVFNYCSTRTLEKALAPEPFSLLTGGDVLIRGGSPGHAMLVIDIAEDARGHRVYLLAQGYMPAQDIHIVKDPAEPAFSPWYTADRASSILETPEYTFTTNQLRAWPKKP